MLPRKAERRRTAARWLLAAAFVAAGYFHLAHPRPFLGITPAWVPHPALVIRVTGWCELAGAAGLLISRIRPVAAAMLALYTVCVYPANIQHMLLFARSGAPWTGWLYHGPRLAFQPVIVWWCLFAGSLIDWPFRSPGPAARAPDRRPGPTG